ncbi:helix-turn-helix domain-containing protein [Gryllotalpicola koreensis]|uniref:Helix-turn-helix domain-containing protein n=1 Tax=Gryllotalpicola koreensis TaxID=993086 RepID=A0ABP8A2L7_9MICO
MTTWLSPTQVSEITGISEVNLQAMRYRRRGIPFYKPDSKTVRYDADEVEAYMRSKVVRPIARPNAA